MVLQGEIEMSLLAAFGIAFAWAGAALSWTSELDSVTRRNIGLTCTLTGGTITILLALLIFVC